MFGKTKKFHFIGIGGIGMSGIAEILLNLGYEISGSDLHDSDLIKRLQKMGAEINVGHSSGNIHDQDVIISSSAIPKANPELIEAHKRNIPVIHRSEMLAELVRMKMGLGVAGTHGKTTTSSIVAHMLTQAGLNPTSVIGGQVFNLGSNATIGAGDYLVFEADESDGSFLNFYPFLSIMTNIDADHMDHYRSFANLKDAFIQYANQVPFYGKNILCYEDPTIREILPEIKKPFMTYGFSGKADLYAEITELHGDYSRFRCVFQGQDLGLAEIPILGRHNILNSLAAIAMGIELDIDISTLFAALKSFKGVGRRMEHIGEVGGIDIYDDYGHHPTEIKATLRALSQKGRRILTVFQPHRFSRTKDLYEDFATSFKDTDVLFLMAIYPAGEEPIEGVSSELIANTIYKYGKPEQFTFEPRWEDLLKKIVETVKTGDIILTLGAGDVTKLSREIARRLIKS